MDDGQRAGSADFGILVMARTKPAGDLSRRHPTPAEKSDAAIAASALERARSASGDLSITAGSGEAVSLAPAVGDLVVTLLGHVARGERVSIVPTDAMLTTRQAAELLNVSRPHLSALLKRGEIAFVPVGSHRRVRQADLLAYKARRDGERNAALGDLARLGQAFDAN